MAAKKRACLIFYGFSFEKMFCQNNLATDKGEIEKAIGFYQKAILLNPDLPNRGEIERLIRKYKVIGN